MIIQCDKCSTKFRLDDSRLTGAGVKVRCTKCQNVFVVAPPPTADSVQIDELFGVPNTFGTTAEEKIEAPSESPLSKAARERSDPNLKFDFEKPEEEKEDYDTDRPSGSHPSSFNDLDFDFSSSAPEEEKASGGLSAEKEEAFSGGMEEKPGGLDFSFDDAGKGAEDETEKGGGWPIGSDGGEGTEEPVQEKAAASPFSAAVYAKEAKEAASSETREESGVKKASDFSDLLTDALSKDADIPELGGEDLEAAKPAPAATKPKARPKILIILILIVIIAGAGLYFNGLLGTSGRGSDSEALNKTVEIETISGYFVDNKNFGRLFVIEAKIKNTADSAQTVNAITGILYGKDGQKIATRPVSAGRVLSADDLKNLPKEDLLKPFKDASGGTIPPKGTVPVMVPFTEVPAEVAEFGLDIIRR